MEKNPFIYGMRQMATEIQTVDKHHKQTRDTEPGPCVPSFPLLFSRSQDLHAQERKRGSAMRKNLIRIFLILLTLVLELTMTSTTTSATVLAPHLHKTTLDNGLTLIVKETPGIKAASVQIWVKAGSVYEEPHEAGITHLIEHMIFKGTPSLGVGGVAKTIEEVGGRINAYTSFESTVYHTTLSVRYWETALTVLTDAVLHSIFDPEELAREKLVVLEEIRMRNDRPSVKLFLELMAQAYTVHPYRLPVSGTEESVSAITRDHILAYIKKHYHPENFTVVIVGDLQYEAVVDKVKALMGDLPKGGFDQPVLAEEPLQKAPRFFLLQEDINQSHLTLCFPISRFKSPDSPVLDVISGILGHGEASRLYHQLRNEKGLVYQIHASAFTPSDPGLFEVSMTLETENITPAITAVLEEFFKLKYVLVAEEELERIKSIVESDFVFNLELVEGQARVLGSFDFLTGDPREKDYLNKIRAVTREDIQRVAAKYFTTDRIITGVLLPEGNTLETSDGFLEKIIKQAENAAEHSVPASQLTDAYLSNVHQFKLPNGIRLIVREDPGVPTVAIRVAFPGGLRGETETTNGSFSFISELLPKGTKDLSARELAVKIADMAGDISGFNGKNTFGVKARFLTRFFDQGLGLVRDVLRTPAFDPDEAEKIRPELLDHLKHQEDSLSSVAFREFNRLLFQGHPYGLNTAGTEEAIVNLSSAELKKLYEKHAVPDRMVLAISGDIKAEEVKETVSSLFGDWAVTKEAATGIIEEIMPPDAPVEPKFFKVERDKQQVHLIVGFLGATLDSPDRYGLEVLDTVLSGQSGRLFAELRDKKSLAYSLSSFSLLGVDTGSFGIYIGTSPDKRDEAIQAVWKELYKVSEEMISDNELQKAKNILISNYELNLQTHSAQALEMALNEMYGLGQNFGNRYVEEINKIDAAKVREIARKYLQTDHYILVSVGAAAPPAAAKGDPMPTGEEKSGQEAEIPAEASPEEAKADTSKGPEATDTEQEKSPATSGGESDPKSE